METRQQKCNWKIVHEPHTAIVISGIERKPILWVCGGSDPEEWEWERETLREEAEGATASPSGEISELQEGRKATALSKSAMSKIRNW
jgi:hypothetical protein